MSEFSSKIDEHIASLKATEKQYEDRVFEEPEKPKWLTDDEPDEDPELIDEIEDEPHHETIVEATSEDLDFYAGGFLGFLTFAIEKLLSWMNGDDPEEHQLDQYEEKHLKRSAALWMKSKKIKAKPSTWFVLTLAVIYGRRAVTGVANMGNRLFGWFKARRAKRDEEEKQLQQQMQKQVEADRQATEEGWKQVNDYIKKLEAKLAAAEQQAQAANDPIPEKEPVPDMSTTPAPPLEVLQLKHQQGKCLLPGCNKQLTNTKVFCGNAHKAAYQGASQRKTDPFPLVRDVTKSPKK